MAERINLNSRYKYWGGHNPQAHPHTKKNYKNTKPLQGNAQTQISFKGFDFQSLKNTFRPIIKKVPESLTQKVFKSLKSVSTEQYKYYTEIKKEYINLVKNSETFRKRFGFSKQAAEEISESTLFYRPKDRLPARFIKNLFAPFRALGRGFKQLLGVKDSALYETRKAQDKVMKEFTSLEGLINSHEIWENGYRRLSGHGRWEENSTFLIPDDVLLSKLKRRRNKVVDPDKGKYSTTSLMLGNRFISGIVYAYFLGNDAYNTTMRYSNNKTEAASQRKSRVAQEFSRIGLNMYIQNLLFGTFEVAVNKSLPTALFVSGSTVAFSEILGRKLVGKPIMPSDKETLDRLEKEMESKKGVLPAVGRLLTRVKKAQPQTKTVSKAQTVSINAKANTEVFSTFSGKSAGPSFKGFYSVARKFEKKKLSDVLQIIRLSDEKQFEQIKESIVHSVKKSKLIKELDNIDIFDKKQIDNAYNIIMNSEALKDIPIGTKKTFVGQLTKSIIVPFRFVRNLFVSTIKGIKSTLVKLGGKQNINDRRNMEKVLNSAEFKEAESFKKFYRERLKLEAWKTSNLSALDKKVKIFEEFMEKIKKQPEEIEGIKNILLWLDKQITSAGIKIQENGTLSPEDLRTVRDLMKKSVMKADGAKHVEYDGNKLSQTNINLARAITTIFLVTDAYNLTMQYSNDNKKDANKSAKNRAAQEISRISFSAYILAFVHNLLSKMCNSSLAGAFGLTTMTSIINDSISRSVVGVPLTAKNKEELEEIDEKNARSKSPIKKALAYSIGKKVSTHQPKTSNFSYAGEGLEDFYITPRIS